MDFYFAFFRQAPAMFLAIAILLGIAAFVANQLSLLLLPFILSLPFLLKKEKWVSYILLPIILAIGSYFYSKYYAGTLPTSDSFSGKGYFVISSKNLSTYFKPTFVYKGTLSYFKSENNIAFHNVPCNIYVSTDREIIGNKDYLITGKLTFKNNKAATLKLDKKRGLVAIENSFNAAEIRYKMKSYVHYFLQKNIKDTSAAIFLSALVTGELDENYLKFSFCRLGLQHILAISGFHFGVLAISFLCIFKILHVPILWSRILLLLIINGYFLFLGPSPSIERAYIALTLALLAALFKQRHFPINALGVALALELLINPLSAANIGFQLSFLSTAALLIIYPVMEKPFCCLFPKRSLQDLKQLSHISIYAHMGASFLRKALALGLAVNIAILPVILFHFHTFPLISLIYNVFFPSLVAISIFLLIIGSVFSLLLPFFPPFIHNFNSVFTKSLLDLATSSPQSLHISIYGHPPFYLIPYYLLVLFLIAIYYGNRNDKVEGFILYT